MWSLWEESHGNSVLCTKCGNCVHAMHFICSKCKGIMKGIVDSINNLCDEVETVNGFCYLADRLNSSGSCEAAVTASVR